MMNHGNMPEQWGHHPTGHSPMGHNQVEPIVCPPVYRCHDQFSQREVPVILSLIHI